MQKFQLFFQLMTEENKDLFDNFKQVHDAYVIAPNINKARFNAVGSEILDVIRDWERRLCGKTESGQYGKFSSGLAGRFWSLIRKQYPKIDFVGIK